MAKHHVTTTVNGDAVEFLCETEDTLLDVLRDGLSLTGSKEGCSSGDCGACSVMLDGRLVCSCLVLGCEAGGHSIETIEGMASGETLHPLQQKFLEHAALQCGVCTPGMNSSLDTNCTGIGDGKSDSAPVSLESSSSLRKPMVFSPWWGWPSRAGF